MTSTALTGCGTALVTPFTESGAIDEPAFRGLVDWQIAEGVQFLVPCGSTGEAATMSLAEQRRVVEITVEQVNGRMPVIAGAGANDTRKAIENSLALRAAGATHLLHVTPMYNKPPQRALLAHFRAIADACDLPIVLYNVPGRTAVNMDAHTCLELANDRRFVAVKEASGNMNQIADIIRDRPDGFAVLSGDDALTLPVMAHGGEGVISVVSNVAPALVAALCSAMSHGQLTDARRLDARLAPLIRAAFVESNPIPIKTMLHMMRRMQNVLRLPLVQLADAHRAAVHSALVRANILSA